MLADATIEIFINNWPMLFIFITIISSIRLAYLFVNEKPFIFYREILALGFVVYMLSLFYAVTFQDVSWSSSNFIPFKELFRYEIGSVAFIKNAIGNILIFLPFGFFVSYILKTGKKRYVFFIGLLASVSIECTQYLIGRVMDVDDITLNVIGAMLGFFVYHILAKLKTKLPAFLKNNMFYNILAILVILAIVLYFATHLGLGV